MDPNVTPPEIKRFQRMFEGVSQADPQVIDSIRGTVNALADVDPLLALFGIGFWSRWLDERSDDLVAASLAVGATWFDIATALGMTRHAAWARYRDPSDGPLV